MTNAAIEKLVQVAVNVAVESKLDYIEEKIQAVLNLGATVGAEVGVADAIKAIERERDNFRKKKLDRKFRNTHTSDLMTVEPPICIECQMEKLSSGLNRVGIRINEAAIAFSDSARKWKIF